MQDPKFKFPEYDVAVIDLVRAKDAWANRPLQIVFRVLPDIGPSALMTTCKSYLRLSWQQNEASQKVAAYSHNK